MHTFKAIRIGICAALCLVLAAAALATDPPCRCMGECPPAKGPNPGTRRYGPLEPELEMGYAVDQLQAVPGVGYGPAVDYPLPIFWRTYYPYPTFGAFGPWGGYYGNFYPWSYRSYYPYYGPYSYSYGPRWYYFNRPGFGYGPYYYWRGPYWGFRRFY